MKLLIGGSPCTFWSIAQTKNRETEPKGLGWELFKNYLIARDKFKPDFFLYENNKSMAAAIRERITWEFGFEPVCLNSALVSAQNRQRLYWIGSRNPDGTYTPLFISPPEDKGILLRDVLDTGAAWREKSYTLDANYSKTPGVYNPHKQHSYSRLQAAEPINATVDGKSGCLRASDRKIGLRNMVGNETDPRTAVAEPAGAYAGRQVGRRINEQGRRDDYNTDLEHIQRFEVNENPDKTNCLTTVTKDNMVAEPVAGIDHLGSLYDQHSRWGIFGTGGKTPTLTASMGMGGGHTPMVPEPLRVGTVENNATNPGHDSKQYRVYSPDAKSTALCGNGGGMGAITGLYAAPCGDCENCKAAGKPVYRVEGG